MFHYQQLQTTVAREEGQAVYEFIVFFPFFLMVMMLIFICGNSINHSINQQKITRGYLYFLTKNNSYAPDKTTLDSLNGVGRIDADSIGWRYDWQGRSETFGSCEKIISPIGYETDETCKKPEEGSTTSAFIRVYTFVGVCGTTWVKDTQDNQYYEDHLGKGRSGCDKIAN